MTALLALAYAASLSCCAGFRPPAVPLVSVDPHFSLWSAADRLYEKDTVHWSGQWQPFRILLLANGRTYRLCGRQPRDLPVLEQKSLHVGATTTSYAFRGDGLAVQVDFCTPKMTDDLEVFAWPVTYLTIRVSGAADGWQTVVSAENHIATNDDKAEVVRSTNAVAGVADIVIGRRQQTPFSDSGDCKRPDWGYVHVVGPQTGGGESRYLLAYDDIKGVRFFGRDLVDWWRRGGKSFDAMLTDALREGPDIRRKCRDFDIGFRADMASVGGEKYATIAELSWRQSFAACRLVASADGEPFYFSAENGSGGMIGTTDVFYPQFPHLLMTSPALAKASLAPTCIYAASTNWPYAYAPHDLGLFPIAEGQWYGIAKDGWWDDTKDDKIRMPVEECGNMLICLAAVAQADGDAGFAGRWWGEVTKWAQYLERFGYDPGEQLCTDDFAGHLAHNANLSIKSIIALRAYAMLAGMRGEAAAEGKYRELSSQMAARWIRAADGGREGASRLAFDIPDSWGQKYNLVWDRLLGFDLFPNDVALREMSAYRKLALGCGLPLDSRKPYTKADWIVWSGSLTGRKEDLAFLCDGLYAALKRTPDRVPFCDWYAADTALQMAFQARSVVGGVFLPVLRHRDLVAKYRQTDGKGKSKGVSE